LAKSKHTPAHDDQPGWGDALHSLKETLRWTLSLGNKLRHKVPQATTLCVLASLTSQTAMLVAFLLPLKVVILLGSDGLPSYYPPILAPLGRETLIIWLSITSVAFYGLNLLAEYLVKISASRGAKRLLASTGKLTLFEDQDEIASNAYKQFTSALAGSLFVVLAILLLLWLYPVIPLLLGIYMTGIVLVLAFASGHASIRKSLEKHPVTLITVVTSVAFLLSFIGIVADFLIGTPPPLTSAIVALLLSRQLTNKIKTSSASLSKLLQHRSQIDALFFHRQILPKEPATAKTVWPLLLPAQRRSWAPQVLAAVAGNEWPAPFRINWWSLGEQNIAALHCEYHDRPGIFLKLFEHNRTRQALHEATLLSVPPLQLPAPIFLGTTMLGGFHCHVLQLPERAARQINEITAQQHLQLLHSLLAVQPPKDLIARYCRSHPLISQRLSESMLQRLDAVAPGGLQELLEIREQIDHWRSTLHAMPPGFCVKPEPGSLLETQDGELLLLHWGNWSLEPCGYGWPTDPQELQRALTAAQLQREDLASTTTDQLLLVALSAELERFLQSGQPDKALPLLAPINDCLLRLDKSQTAH
jgi:hypothetical protein